MLEPVVTYLQAIIVKIKQVKQLTEMILCQLLTILKVNKLSQADMMAQFLLGTLKPVSSDLTFTRWTQLAPVIIISLKLNPLTPCLL
jgi:hypothetical protein